MTVPFARHAVLLGILSFALAGCAFKPSPHSETGSKPLKETSKRNKAPNFNLKDADGRLVSLADYKGKVVLLNFWATWCGPCKIEIPWFVEFQKTYKDKGFTVIGIAVDDEGWEVVKPYINAKQVNYPVVVGTQWVDNAYGGIEALPTTFVIDREGRIARTHVGLVSKSDYESDIQQLLD